MADFLTIAGTAVEIRHEGASQRKSEEIGETVRTFSGALRSTVRAEKRQWDFLTAPMPLAQGNAIRALRGFRACSGAALGDASITCWVSIGDAPYTPSGASFEVALAISLQEA